MEVRMLVEVEVKLNTKEALAVARMISAVPVATLRQYGTTEEDIRLLGNLYDEMQPPLSQSFYRRY